MEGNALLFSQAYTTVQARDTGIASVTKNAGKPDRYERVLGEGQPFFLIRAGNMKEIARSRYFANSDDMESVIGWLQAIDFANISAGGSSLDVGAAAAGLAGAAGATVAGARDLASSAVSGAGDAVGETAKDIGGAAQTAGKAVAGTASSVAASAGGAGRAAVDAGTSAASGAASGGMKWLWWLIPLLLLVGLLWMMRGCLGDAAESVGDAASGAVDAAGEVAGAAGEAAAGAAAAAGEMAGDAADAAGEAMSGAADAVASMFDFGAAPSWSDLGLPEGGVLASFIGFLKGGGDSDQTFTLDRVKFETASATLAESSMDQLDNVVKVLNAYSSISVELQGHTDNTGSYDANKSLSDQRANSVRDYLISKGIDGNRLTAVGFGSDNPIASNDTDTGRAQNRRTDLRVTKK